MRLSLLALIILAASATSFVHKEVSFCPLQSAFHEMVTTKASSTWLQSVKHKALAKAVKWLGLESDAATHGCGVIFKPSEKTSYIFKSLVSAVQGIVHWFVEMTHYKWAIKAWPVVQKMSHWIEAATKYPTHATVSLVSGVSVEDGVQFSNRSAMADAEAYFQILSTLYTPTLLFGRANAHIALDVGAAFEPSHLALTLSKRLGSDAKFSMAAIAFTAISQFDAVGGQLQRLPLSYLDWQQVGRNVTQSLKSYNGAFEVEVNSSIDGASVNIIMRPEKLNTVQLEGTVFDVKRPFHLEYVSASFASRVFAGECMSIGHGLCNIDAMFMPFQDGRCVKVTNERKSAHSFGGLTRGLASANVVWGASLHNHAELTLDKTGVGKLQLVITGKVGLDAIRKGTACENHH